VSDSVNFLIGSVMDAARRLVGYLQRGTCMDRIRYAIVGLGGRSPMFTNAVAGTYADRAELVGMCDLNRVRMELANQRLGKHFGCKSVPMYASADFDRMIAETKPQVVIVTSMDRTHHRYICRAMELGCDAICEKPMTVDEHKCQQILDTIAATGRKLQVTFNYRYAPRNSKVKELLQSGVIGQIVSVHFEWLLDTQHGADYFRRWHRDKRNSGGLMVHKATHHFDLVNWWIDSKPKTVFGMGDLRFYGRENAEERGVTRFYDRATGHPNAVGDPFALHLDQNPDFKAMYLDAEKEDGYQRDQSVFGHNISIEDDMAVMVRYHNRATMTYHLTAYSPWEGFRVMFNGTKGRIEHEVEESSFSRDADGPAIEGAAPYTIPERERILLRTQWAKPQVISVGSSAGGHGGGDERLLADIFAPGTQADPLGRAADHVDGAWSILTGIAANKSFACGLPIDAASLVRFHQAAAADKPRSAAGNSR
jgi:predicted dehydrogenase